MKYLWILLAILAAVALLVLLISYICFRMAFYASRKKCQTEEFPIPEGEIYEPYRPVMTQWMKEVRAMPCQEFSIRSFDGLKLVGKYYEYAPGATMELMFHGYRGNAERDLCGGVQRCFALGRNALIVDQRTSSGSEGNVISFGINEHKDCLAWVDFLVSHFGPDVKIILTGISMGGSTVMMAAGEKLPKQVVGVLSDCGFSSAKDIIKTVIRQMKLPATLLYPFVKLGARIYGNFDLEENSPVEAVKRCKLPMIFVHGEADDYVPCDMSRVCYEACGGPKELHTVPGAGHGLAYLVEGDGYLETLADFWSRNGVPTEIVK